MENKKTVAPALHEEIDLNPETRVLKVQGGWIYKFYRNVYDKEGNEHDELVSAVFVPSKIDFVS